MHDYYEQTYVSSQKIRNTAGCNVKVLKARETHEYKVIIEDLFLDDSDS